jgi:hypothetical protein
LSRRRLLQIVGLLLASWALAGVSWAHHSYAAFDMMKRLLVKGTVQSFEWTNPHCWVRVIVPNADGSTTIWNVEAGSPNVNARRGWVPLDMRPGDKVELTIYPLRDGSPGGSLVSVTLADGRILRAR